MGEIGTGRNPGCLFRAREAPSSGGFRGEGTLLSVWGRHPLLTNMPQWEGLHSS